MRLFFLTLGFVIGVAASNNFDAAGLTSTILKTSATFTSLADMVARHGV